MKKPKPTKITIHTSFLAVALTCAPACAQEQTAENAQRFIAQLGEMGNISYVEETFQQPDLFTMRWEDKSGPNTVVHTQDKEAFPLWNVRSEGECKTVFARKYVAYSPLANALTVQDLDEVIDWTRVNSVVRHGQHVDVDGSSMFKKRFTLPDVQLATRVEYAMEFLRLSCDRTGGTGF